MKQRRKVLKAVGAGITTKWATPLVASIALPAHAQTSPAFSQSFSMLCDSDATNEIDAILILFDETTLNPITFDCCGAPPASNGNRITIVDVDDSNPISWELVDSGDTNWNIISQSVADEVAITSDQTVSMVIERQSVGNIGQQYSVEIIGTNLSGTANVLACSDFQLNIDPI